MGVTLPGGSLPLLAVAAVAIGIGFGVSAMYATTQLAHPLVAPDAAYYLLTTAGIAVSLGIIAATFPLLRRITGPEVARNEAARQVPPYLLRSPPNSLASARNWPKNAPPPESCAGSPQNWHLKLDQARRELTTAPRCPAAAPAHLSGQDRP
jgi:hypothetical protein